jgi:hypothetical protein
MRGDTCTHTRTHARTHVHTLEPQVLLRGTPDSVQCECHSPKLNPQSLSNPLSCMRMYHPERDLIPCQKRPNTVSKETEYRVKRDLIPCQKRPNTVSKEN